MADECLSHAFVLTCTCHLYTYTDLDFLILPTFFVYLQVDLIHKCMLPLFKHFMITEKLDMKIVHRGAPPNGGGQVVFTCPIVRHLRAASLLSVGRVKRVRGLSYALRMSPAMANRIVDGARSVLDKFLKDVYIFTDHHKGASSGKSPQFGVSLVAETTEGVLYASEGCSKPPTAGEITIPEELGQTIAMQLVENIWQVRSCA